MDIWQIISLIAGLVFMYLQIKQNRYMWYVQIVTGTSAAIVFSGSHLWASMSLNIYYVIMSFVGIYNWKRLKDGSDNSEVKLVRPERKIVILSAVLFLILLPAVIKLLQLAEGANPIMDALVLLLSAMGTLWLSRSYLEQWCVWMAADLIGLILNFTQGLYGMSAVSLMYFVASIIGFFHWRKEGQYIDVK